MIFNDFLSILSIFSRFLPFLPKFCDFCQNFGIFGKFHLLSIYFYFFWFLVIFSDFLWFLGQIGPNRASPGMPGQPGHKSSYSKNPFHDPLLPCKKSSQTVKRFPRKSIWSKTGTFQSEQRSLHNSRSRVIQNTGPVPFERGPFVSSKLPELDVRCM